MLRRLHSNAKQYPQQFWLLFWGMLVATAGTSMIWPFLMIYVKERLNLPMTATASLMSLNAGATLFASVIAGPITDKAGRKGTMVIGLAATGISYLAMIPAKTLPAFAILMTLRGLFNPLYRVGSDAMVADIIPTEKRADAYALTRLSRNVGIALGPALGGFVTTRSYSIAFIAAAICLAAFSLLVACFIRESLPVTITTLPLSRQSIVHSYRQIAKDIPFVMLVGAFTLTQISSSIMWVLLSVYAKENYQIRESQYGFIPMTNALMVVLLQLFVTRRTKRRLPLQMLALGAMLYALGIGSIALGSGYWDFWISIVIITIGELILVPTATTYVADLAPIDMRGRYMSIFSLTWGVASGIGPVVGGYLNDNISPQSIWVGGGVIGMVGAFWFFLQAVRQKQKTVEMGPTSTV